MTAEQIRAMSNAELDAQIAERVMGWTPAPHIVAAWIFAPGKINISFYPSTDWSSAHLGEEEMRRRGVFLLLVNSANDFVVEMQTDCRMLCSTRNKSGQRALAEALLLAALEKEKG